MLEGLEEKLEEAVEKLSNENPDLIRGAITYGRNLEELFVKLTDALGTDNPGQVLSAFMLSLITMNVAMEDSQIRRTKRLLF